MGQLAVEWHHTARAIRWGPWLLAVGASTAVLVILGDGPSALPLQLTAFLLGASSAFAVDDATGEILSSSPRSLWSRRLARLAVVVPATAAVWGLALLADLPSNLGEGLAFTAMMAGFFGLALGAAAVGCRVAGWTHGGVVAAPTLVVALILSSTLPPSLRLMPTGDVPGGMPAIWTRWGLVCLIGGLVLRLASTDPAGRRLASFAPRRHGPPRAPRSLTGPS